LRAVGPTGVKESASQARRAAQTFEYVDKNWGLVLGSRFGLEFVWVTRRLAGGVPAHCGADVEFRRRGLGAGSGLYECVFL
jgi:hypothetical protein